MSPINRSEMRLTVASIRDHLDIIDRFLADLGSDRECELEILGRCGMIEARLAQLRIGAVAGGPHVTGERLRHVSRESRA